MSKEKNVPDEILEIWDKNKRPNDAGEICKALGITYPTVRNALKNGYVAKSYLVTAITDFFTKRREREISDAEKLNSLSTTQN